MNWWPPKARRVMEPSLRPLEQVSYDVVPGEPIYDAEIVEDNVVALRTPAAPPRYPETAYVPEPILEYLRCGECSRQVNNVRESQLRRHGKPCPLCADCRDCRQGCASGRVRHEYLDTESGEKYGSW